MNSAREVLIVDDDPKNIFALTATLKSKGYSCISCNSAEDALSLLTKREDIGVILLDMMMPEMDGYDAIPYLRKCKNYETVPIIAVTAQAMQGDQEKCIAAGASGYISKPIDVDKLMYVLSQYIQL